ncbi:MAG: hypothetical protein EAZ35_02265 [Sphingobacteriia bacterium]|nr:MAG: hypothetical protein EAZ35_02265 [Sphingobacteriia bacterium]
MELLIKKIYEVFQANQAVFLQAGLEPVQTIDLFRDQPLNPEAFEYFATPALFLGFAINWERNGHNYTGKAVLDVHVVIDSPFDGVANNFTNHEEALKKVFYYKIVKAVLDNLESAETNKLIRASERPVDTGVIVYNIISYECNIYDAQRIGSNNIMVGDAIVAITGKQLVKELPQ